MKSQWKLAALVGFALSAMPLAAQADTEIDYRERVTLKVGQSVVVYGFRGDCGELPTSDQIDLPVLKTGKLSVGKPGKRGLQALQRDELPAVQIIFTAETEGREKFELQGDDISVRVQN